MGTREMLRSHLSRAAALGHRQYCTPAFGSVLQRLKSPAQTAPSAIAVPQEVARAKEQPVELRHEINDPVTGIPESQLSRKVYVFSPTKSAMQSGGEKIGMWKMEFENPERWRNPLMGYVSSADPASNLKMKFPTKESALAYAEKMGYDYELQESVYPEENSNDRGIVKSYSDVFKFKGKKLRKRVFSV